MSWFCTLRCLGHPGSQYVSWMPFIIFFLTSISNALYPSCISSLTVSLLPILSPSIPFHIHSPSLFLELSLFPPQASRSFHIHTTSPFGFPSSSLHLNTHTRPVTPHRSPSRLSQHRYQHIFLPPFCNQGTPNASAISCRRSFPSLCYLGPIFLDVLGLHLIGES